MDIYPPLPSFSFQVAAVAGYWATLIILKGVMKDRPAFSLRSLCVVHNLIFTVLSLALVIGFGHHFYVIYRDYGLFETYCGANPEQDNKLGFWLNFFYLSKFYEFFDTVIIVLKKRPVSKLHLIHHSLTGIVTWNAINGGLIMAWITAFNNSLIHVFMYWYYFKQTLGIDVWWKKYLTTGQIIQFIIDIGTAMPFIYFWYIQTPCRGTLVAWLSGNAGGSLFLLMFVNFYISTYIKKQADKKKKHA